MSKCLVLFVEGDTEVEFYKQVIANARKLRPNGKFDTNIECKSINGVGGFKNIVLRKFVKEIKTKYDDDCVFTVVLCRDTDVFELSPKPPIKWDEVERDLRANGAADVIHVEARHSIEDWFLYDAEGIISFLRLNKKTKVSSKKGGKISFGIKGKILSIVIVPLLVLLLFGFLFLLKLLLFLDRLYRHKQFYL